MARVARRTGAELLAEAAVLAWRAPGTARFRGGVPASRGCAPGSTAYALRDDASSMATISTIAFVAGGVALAGGLTLFLVAPKRSGGASAAVAPTPGGVLFSGRF